MELAADRRARFSRIKRCEKPDGIRSLRRHISDEGLKGIGQVKCLQKLHLGQTEISDAGLRNLRHAWKPDNARPAEQPAINGAGLADLHRLKAGYVTPSCSIRN